MNEQEQFDGLDPRTPACPEQDEDWIGPSEPESATTEAEPSNESHNVIIPYPGIIEDILCDIASVIFNHAHRYGEYTTLSALSSDFYDRDKSMPDMYYVCGSDMIAEYVEIEGVDDERGGYSNAELTAMGCNLLESLKEFVTTQVLGKKARNPKMPDWDSVAHAEEFTREWLHALLEKGQ